MASTPTRPAQLRIVPANRVSWDDLRAVVGAARCFDALCFCQRFKILHGWHAVGEDERAHRLRAQSECGHPRSAQTSGLVGFVGDEAVAWCAVEPRTAYVRLTRQVTWSGRAEDKTDGGVWAVTCTLTRTPYRRQGFTYEMIAAAVEFARERGAHAVEGYGMLTEPGREITWGELHVGSRNAFAAAGFREVTRPTKRRVVMRTDL
ncbi:MAG TPA: GNAT family N-acetyltransferase [Acidimicrobiales bacterium]|nr:GNAT family N-acetyltransferase [Acidimicrobiales bacterium]